jgi:putative transposase
MLNVMDEYTRECLAIQVERKLKAGDVQECLTELFCKWGVPEYIRSDNGSEFTAKMIRTWLNELGTRTLFIEPGSPWENGYIEIFYTLQEAKILIERWRRDYNRVRPHSALGYKPPAPEVVLVLCMTATLCTDLPQGLT